MNQSVSALIVDDHQLYRDGLSSLLEKNSFVKQVFQAENGLEAVFQMRRNPLPLIFMDLKMPVMDGYEAIKIIHKEFPKTTILVLSDFLQPYLIHELDTIGADGYLTKGTSNHELSEAINWMFSGGVGQKPYLSKEVKEMQKQNDELRSMVESYNDWTSEKWVSFKKEIDNNMVTLGNKILETAKKINKK